MAKVLLRIVDKTSDDPAKDCRLRKRGDVVCVVPDTHEFSEFELNHPEWRVLSIPSLSVEDAETWRTPDDAAGQYRHRCKYRFNIDALPAAIQQQIASREQPVVTVPLSRAAALALRVQKAPYIPAVKVR